MKFDTYVEFRRCLLIICYSAIFMVMATPGAYAGEWEMGRLYQIVYTDKEEHVTDLCDISNVLDNSITEPTIIADPGNLNITPGAGQFKNPVDWSDLKVEICAGEKSTNSEYCYFAKITDTASDKDGGDIGVRSGTKFYAGIDTFIKNFDVTVNKNKIDTDTGWIAANETINSYKFLLCSNGTTYGQYAGLNLDTNMGYASLNVFKDNVAEYVDMYLYRVKKESRTVTLIKGNENDYVAVIRVKKDGSTILNPKREDTIIISPIDDAQIETEDNFELSVSVEGGDTAFKWEVESNPEIPIYISESDSQTYTPDSGASSCTLKWNNATVLTDEETVPINITVTAYSESGIPTSKSFILTYKNKNYVPPVEPVLKKVQNVVLAEETTREITISLSNEATIDNWKIEYPPELSNAVSGVKIENEYKLNLKNLPLGGPYTITVTASNKAGSDEVNFKVTVNTQKPVKPKLASITPKEAVEGETFEYFVHLDNLAIIDVWQLSGDDLPGNMTITDGLISWDNCIEGTYNLKVTAKNDAGSDTESFILKVSDNGTPIDKDIFIDDIDNSKLIEGESYTLQPGLKTNSGIPDRWELVNGPEDMTFNVNTGKITWTAVLDGDDTETVYNIEIKAENTSTKKSDQESWSVTVVAENTSPSNDAPVIEDISDVDIIEGDEFIFIPELVETSGDVDKWEMSVSGLGNENSISFDSTNGKITWSDTEEGEYTILLTAINTESALEDQASFVLTVKKNPTVNQSPTVPEPIKPAHSEIIPSSKVTLIVDSALDPDGDEVRYLFEIYMDNRYEKLLDKSDLQLETWWDVRISLSNYQTYYWHVKAIDSRGGSSAWSELRPFNTNIVALPLSPVLSTPISGGVVISAAPVLSVYNIETDETEENPVNYQFQIFDSPEMIMPVFDTITNPLAGMTILEVPYNTLEDGKTYYWHARANFSITTSSWMTPAVLKIDTSGLETRVAYDKEPKSVVDPSDIRKIEIVDKNSPIFMTSVEIPPNTLNSNLEVRIGSVSNPPELPVNIKSNGSVIDFSPSGVFFNEQVTIRIPYKQDDLDISEVNTPKDLDILKYDPISDSWGRVNILNTETYEDMEEDAPENAEGDVILGHIIGKIDHFSLYTIGKMYESETEIPEEPADCFISTLSFATK